jgi:tellurite methyltransferase
MHYLSRNVIKRSAHGQTILEFYDRRDSIIPMSTEDVWQKYSAVTQESPARPRLLAALDSFFANRPGHALDLGCGGGRDTKELLRRGWMVDALDSNESALALTKKLQTPDNRLNIIHTTFDESVLIENQYDLVNASVSLPFCHPAQLPILWQKIVSSIKSGGFVTCDFFGVNDEWNSGRGETMSFLPRQGIENLFLGFKIHTFGEKEMDAPTALGVHKHWHLFDCTAQKS